MRAPFVSDDLLSRAISSLGADADELRCRYGGRTWDMDRICTGCPARGRCRRDLATSDFVRRYRLYCPNAGSLAEIAASVMRPASGDHRAPPAATA